MRKTSADETKPETCIPLKRYQIGVLIYLFYSFVFRPHLFEIFSHGAAALTSFQLPDWLVLCRGQLAFNPTSWHVNLSSTCSFHEQINMIPLSH